MDDSIFHHLVRKLASPVNRRQALGAILAGALSFGAVRRTEARTCTQIDRTCREHATCCSGFCSWPSSSGRRTCAPPSRNLFVSALDGQNGIGLATGLVLKTGRSVTISAVDDGANCNITDDPPGCVDGPNGKPGWLDNGALAPNIDLFSLIARVGSGPWIKIGLGPVTVSGNGQLYLAYNDLLTEYDDNAGGFTVTVTFV